MNRISFLNRGYAFKGLLAVKGVIRKLLLDTEIYAFIFSLFFFLNICKFKSLHIKRTCA